MSKTVSLKNSTALEVVKSAEKLPAPLAKRAYADFDIFVENVDKLTALIERAQALHAQKGRDPSRHFAWVMIDLDHFKSVNDRFGHPVGDRVLATLAALLRRRLRQSDTIGRYGGEEFVVLFEGLPEPDVVHLMGRVLEEFREIDLEAPGKPSFRATFSAGVAMLTEEMTLDGWKKAADDALYAAKAAGRNRITSTADAPAISDRRRGGPA